MPRLEVRDVSLWHDSRRVLENISPAVSPERLLVLVGPNGTGKGRLLAVLAGRLSPDEGQVRMDGIPLARWSPRTLARRRPMLMLANSTMASSTWNHDGLLHRCNHGVQDAHSPAVTEKQHMSNNDRTKVIPRRTPESAAMLANIKRGMAITAELNRLTFNDADEVRTLFAKLIGQELDESFLLIPPFYTTGGTDIRVGHHVFINQNCTFYDLGGLDISDDVMIGPNVSLITSGHPVEPSRRHDFVVAKPIVIERNVWVAAGAIIIGGVTVGEGSVVAAGSVVTRDVPPHTLVGGNPASVIRSTRAEQVHTA